jgi:transketolase
MRDTFARALHAVAQTDPKTFIVVSDISPAASMAPFRDQFPDHFINVGVAEQSMIGICAGLAQRGCTPFAYTIGTFTLYRPFEQVRDDLCYQNLPVTLVGIGGGVSYANLGSTHHTLEDIALMSALPNMSIIAPCDPFETEAATWACAKHDGPVYLRLGRAGEPDLTSKAAEPFEFGKLRMIKPGKDVCILSYGPIMTMALEAAQAIEQQNGCSVGVASVHTLKPLDQVGISKILESYESVVVLEEHSLRGGLAAQVKEMAWDRGAKCKLHTFSLKDEFLHIYTSQQDLWRAHGLSTEKICEAVTGS